ncbi:extracellular solute-binding protein [bacterium]|nr:extracellular solute-binding protein [bacterium]
MKYFLISIFGILALWTLVTVALIPGKEAGDKTSLVWTTDPNPQREMQVDIFNKLYPDCSLRIDPDNSGVMKVVVQSSAGMGPDIIGQIHIRDNYQIYHEAGLLWDITEQAKKMGFGPETLPEPVRPLVMMRVMNKNGEFEDRQYVYPCNVYHGYIIYNKNIFDKYGISYPPEDLTWEEYINIAKKLTIYENEGDKIPLIFGSAGMGSYLKILIWEKGEDVFNKDGTRCLLNRKGVIEAMVFYHDILFKHNTEPTPTQQAGVSSQGGAFGSGYMSWFGGGKVAMFWGARWNLIQFRRFVTDQRQAKEEWIKEHPDADKYEGPEVLRMGACFVPRFKQGRRYTVVRARCVGINKKSKNREAALNFMQYLTSEEYSQIINQGADAKPGNKKYINMNLFRHPDWPGEEEVHLMSIKSIPYGRIVSRSMFISNATVERILKKTTDQLIADPELKPDDIAQIMQRASDKINLEISRAIERNPHLQKIYKKLLSQGAEPIVTELDKDKPSFTEKTQ